MPEPNKKWVVIGMHGLINRALQCFLRDTYGQTRWQEIASVAELPASGFESMFIYDDSLTERMVETAAQTLDKPRTVLLEDLGTYLVSHPNMEALRRLLRFGGETFLEFLQSIDDLPRRAKLAVPDLSLPSLEVYDHPSGVFEVVSQWNRPGFGHVLVGVMRTMADDYGALVLLEHTGLVENEERIAVRILQNEFTEGKPFALSAGGLA